MEYSLKIWFSSRGLGTLVVASSLDFFANMGMDGLGIMGGSSIFPTSSSRYLLRRGFVHGGALCEWDFRNVGYRRPIDP